MFPAFDLAAHQAAFEHSVTVDYSPAGDADSIIFGNRRTGSRSSLPCLCLVSFLSPRERSTFL
jgi:hypothetical protein